MIEKNLILKEVQAPVEGLRKVSSRKQWKSLSIVLKAMCCLLPPGKAWQRHTLVSARKKSHKNAWTRPGISASNFGKKKWDLKFGNK